MPDFNWDYWRSLQGGPQAAPSAATVALPTERDVPGQIVQGVTPGVWETIQGPHQGSGPEQAMAEYEARTARPRNDIWGQTLAEDRPENLARELFAPFQRGLQTGMAALKPAAKDPKVYKSGSDGYVFDPVSRQFDRVFQGDKKPVTEPRPYSVKETDANGNVITRRLTKAEFDQTPSAETQKQLQDYAEMKAQVDAQNFRLGPDWNPMASDRRVKLAALRQALQQKGVDPEVTAQPAAPSAAPQGWQVDPSTIPVGVLNSFMVPPMPGSTPAARQPSRRKYNPTTGRLE